MLGTLAQPTVGLGLRTRDAPSRLSKDVDRGHSRRVALGWLCSLQAGASIVGGVVTFAHKRHDGAGLVQFDTIGAILAIVLDVVVVVTAGIILLSYGGLRSVLTGGVALFLAISAYGFLRSVGDGSDPRSRLLALAYLGPRVSGPNRAAADN